MSEPLKDCPLCGTEAHLYANEARNAVECMSPKCLATTRDFETEEEAIEAWNRRVTPWRNFHEVRPQDGQECWIWCRLKTPRGWRDDPVTPTIYKDEYFKGDGDYYYEPQEGVLLWTPAHRPAPPSAEEIEAAMKGEK